MIDLNTQLTVLIDTSTGILDISKKVAEFGRDLVTFTWDDLKPLYFGFEKPINALYVNLESENHQETTLTLSAWNGTSYVVVPMDDDTLGFHRSGFIQWEYPNHVKTLLNGKNLYWYKLNIAHDRNNVKVRGLNIVFSDDFDLKVECPEIMAADYLGNHKSHILGHVSSRNEIMQFLRNKNYVKIIDNVVHDLTAWDLFDIHEINLASVYLTLSKIFSNVSDNPEDIMWFKYNQYKSKYENAMNNATLSLDLNGDGIKNDEEIKLPTNLIRANR